MAKKKYFFSVFLLIIIFSLVSFTLSVNAQSVGTKISPVKIEDMVDPGEVVNASIKVTNESSVSKILFAYVRDFKAGSENGTPEIIASQSEPGPYLSTWVDITKEALNFAPGEEKEIKYTIKVPANIGPGGYYGAIVFGTEPPKIKINSEDKGAAMVVAQQTGALILLQVKGDVLEDANVREFSTDKKFYSTPFDIKFLTRIENKGNVHIKPHGQINITNMLGKSVVSLDFNNKGANILPQSIRRFENNWAKKIGLGRYQASLILNYGVSANEGGQGKQTLFSTITFWIIPWRLLIPGFIAALIIGLILFLLLRFYKNKAVTKAMEQMGLGQIRYVRKYQGPSPALHLAVIVSSLLFGLFLIFVIIYFMFFA